MSASLEDRLTELETRLAFVDDTCAALSDAIAAHDRQLYEFGNALQRLREELVAIRGSLIHDAGDESPPHY